MTETAVTQMHSLLAARLRLHLRILPTSIGLSALLGSVTTAAQWDDTDHHLLLTWAGVLTLVLALRVWVGWAYKHACDDSPGTPATTWLLRHRLCFFAHGIVWGIGGLVLQDPVGVVTFSLLTITIVAIAASSLNTTTFDINASLAFLTPALAPMLLAVFMLGDRVATIRGLIMVTFMVSTFIGARRAERIFVEAEQARSKLADQYRLLTEAELSLKTYKLVANSITDMVSVIGEDLEYRMVNDAWCESLGLSREEALNRKTSDVLSRSVSTDERRAALNACISEQRVQLIRSRIDFPNGTTRQVETTYYPYMDADSAQNVRCVVMVSRDVTQAELARQQLAESAKYLQRTLNATGDAIFATESVTPNEPVRFVNEQMLDMWGIPRDKLTTLTPRDIMAYTVPLLAEPEADLRHVEEIVETNVQHESQVRLTDGRVLLRRCVPAQIGENTLRVWSFRDITERKLAEQQLAASNEQLRHKSEELQLTLDSIDEGIVSFDVNGVVGIHNQNSLTLTNLPPNLFDRLKTYDDIVRFQVQRGDLAGDGGFIDAYGQHQYFEGGRRNSPELYVRKNSSGAMIEVRTRQLDNGGLVRTFSDVTSYLDAQKAVRESEAEIRALLDAFPGYIAALDAQLRYTYVNERLAGLLGKTPTDMVGHYLHDMVGGERLRFVVDEIRTAKSGLRSVSFSHYPGDGARADLDMEVLLVAGRMRPDGGQTVYVFGTDITARKQAEDALIAARDAAESASRAKSDFLSNMSHELRTPMNAILGFGQLLELDQQTDADRQDWGHEVVKGGRHLLTLINEVLDLARVESGKMPVTLEPLAVQPVIDDCLMLVRQQASERNIRLFNHTIPANLGVQADRTRLKQIVLNLLSNAIKYNVIAGTVVLTCEPDPADPQHQARISVTDSGGGLTPAQIAKLFQPFERVDTRVEHIEGSGIGLVLTKRLVELLNGQIGVDSPPGQGCSFWVTLPLVALSEKDT